MACKFNCGEPGCNVTDLTTHDLQEMEVLLRADGFKFTHRAKDECYPEGFFKYPGAREAQELLRKVARRYLLTADRLRDHLMGQGGLTDVEMRNTIQTTANELCEELNKVGAMFNGVAQLHDKEVNKDRQAEAEKKASELLGRPVDLNKPEDMAEVMVKLLGLPKEAVAAIKVVGPDGGMGPLGMVMKTLLGGGAKVLDLRVGKPEDNKPPMMN